MVARARDPSTGEAGGLVWFKADVGYRVREESAVLTLAAHPLRLEGHRSSSEQMSAVSEGNLEHPGPVVSSGWLFRRGNGVWHLPAISSRSRKLEEVKQGGCEFKAVRDFSGEIPISKD